MGDVDGDGYPELLVTALGDYGSGDSGKAYVVDGLCLDGEATTNINAASLFISHCTPMTVLVGLLRLGISMAMVLTTLRSRHRTICQIQIMGFLTEKSTFG